VDDGLGRKVCVGHFARLRVIRPIGAAELFWIHLNQVQSSRKKLPVFCN
jgi:hypothetical protein